MTSIENFKSGMGSGLKKFFENYEDSMKELIDNLDSDGLLLRKFDWEKVIQLMKLTKSCNMSLKLSEDLTSTISLNKTKRKENLNYLKKAFRIKDEKIIGEHCLIALVNSYVAFLEKLKMYFLFFIDWDKLGKKHKDIFGIGMVIDILKKRYPKNEYLKYFYSGPRNSFAHYTFFFAEKSNVYLCKSIFDDNPKKMTLENLMKGDKELNVLTEGFYVFLADKFGLPEINFKRFKRGYWNNL